MTAPSLDFVTVLVKPRGEDRIASAPDLRSHLAGLSTVDTVERAALGGVGAQGVGWAFACGYEAALRRLDPTLAAGTDGERATVRLGALCASEAGGGHPRAIQATLTSDGRGGYALTGDKTWVTLGAEADVLLVVAAVGQDDRGRNRLRVARVPAGRAGVTLQTGAPLPFAPEIGHARVSLREVPVAEGELLDGDGYDAVLKPFRTIEDTHVLAAVLAWGVGVGRASGGSSRWTEQAIATLLALRAIGQADPSRPATHLALAGAMDLARSLLEGADWSLAPEAVRSGWERDRPLLDVARNARTARLEAAWRGLAGDP